MSANQEGIIIVESYKLAHLKGWCVDHDLKRSSSIAYIRITDVFGTECYLISKRVKRPDIVNIYKSSAMLIAGVEVTFDTSLLPEGIYQLAFIQIFTSSIDIAICDTKLEIFNNNSLDLSTESV
jgi:hypothetical protein